MAFQMICTLIKVHHTLVAITCLYIVSVVIDTDQLHPLDVDIWEHLMSRASNPPPFYSTIFGCLADSFIRRNYSLNRSDFTVLNIEGIYCSLIDYFSVFC